MEFIASPKVGDEEDVEEEKEEEEWMVLEIQYPTSYGCNRGRKWKDFELYRRSTRE